ncbi:CDC73-domain-containing protein [Tilletiaria anomala UBC 951]|uniref:CDC73-domain-containing protein n=1 Tax=Tilletiaria anomala (strain ATCC 24038 / CBS 436.72 / UBC 951) TaxID=1037660 RepID=A0A066VPI3_TILAU|nr:CDC73-domain-containing protein [Tilletiaria anomala UBC 951]KDN43662.1 CDC73-domain-containing protein [Tilletiaria anomala UBC 951]
MDALEALRAAVAPTGDLTNVKLLSSSNEPVCSVSEAASVQIAAPAAPSPLFFPKDTVTRIATNKATLAAPSDVTGQTPTPSADPSSFLPLDALIFAIQTKDEPSASYVRLCTASGAARLALVERPPILEFLLGKRDAWEGAVSLAVVQAQAAVKVPTATAVPTAATAVAGSTTPPGSPPPEHKRKYTGIAGAGTAHPSTKRVYVPNKADAEFVKRLRRDTEVILRTRNDSMRGTKPWAHTVDFSSFREKIKSRLEIMKRIVTNGSSSSRAPLVSGVKGATSSGVGPMGSGLVRKQRAQHPIIMLSNSPTAMINMFNVKAFLEQGIFIAPDQARKDAGGIAEPIVTIDHRLGSHAPSSGGGDASGASRGSCKQIRFLVVDSQDGIQKLSGSFDANAAWNRVIVVFTTGQTWQFNKYKHTEPTDLFKNVLGMYVRFNNDQPNENVKNWNVKELLIGRTQRHTDRQIVAFFWRSVETWMHQRKPHLLA